jgi:hypothetical protein
MGRGSDIGSDVEDVRRCEANRTGPAAGRDIKFSGFSSQSGVPGREPSESASSSGGEDGVRGAPKPVTLAADIMVSASGQADTTRSRLLLLAAEDAEEVLV